jgi:cation diffusion facilitator CzcD-associated flavoprotein CzcO
VPTADELRARYRAERDKRLRIDGNEQYVEPTGRFAHFVDDIWTPRVEREPVHEEVEVAVIGAGFAGLVTGARLKQAGIDDVRLIDGAGDVGGVWYWNRYPGAMCDTAAMIYLPLLEETGHMPSQKYTMAPEIFEHAKRIATTFGLYEGALFSTSITSLDWNAEISRWIVRTDRGDELRARFVTMGTGPLHRPKLPGVPGIETFEGHAFHTSRWDYAYTGGAPDDGRLSGLADKRVGIIGTGATSVQCIPHLARSAQELLVFQRTPSSVDARNNRPIDPEWFATLEPGWQDEWRMNFTILQTGGFADADLVQDGWTDISQRIRDRIVAEMTDGEIDEFGPEAFRQAYEASDDEKMEEIRARVDALVADQNTADALKPWYRQLCKRPCFHDEYLQSLNLPGVRLIDTDGQGVERIDATGVWIGGEHFELDCLIFASGFEVGTEHARRAGFETTGRAGVTLTDHWADGMQSLHGIHVSEFPNLFIVGPTQGANLISNITHNLVEAAATISKVIAHAREVGAHEVEVTQQAESEWVALIDTHPGTIFGDTECTPGYYNAEGREQTQRDRRNSSGYPLGSVAYFQYISAWRTSGDFAGLDFRS